MSKIEKEPIVLTEKENRKNKTYNCPDCSVQFNLNSLRIHYTKAHSKSSKRLCAILFYNGTEPTCKCGCGGEVYFFGLMDGFGSYVKGHHVREYDKNPWNKTNGVEAKKKSKETKKKLFEEGKFKYFDGKAPWNKGKRKALDPEYAARIKFTDTIEFKQNQAKTIKKNMQDGKILPRKGEDSSLWRGGVSSLNSYSRASHELYQKWVYPCLVKDEFKCQYCGVSNGQLEVHHDGETFSSILRKIAKAEGWLEKHFLNERLENPDQETLDLKNKIRDLVTKYHVENNVSGISLCKECHENLHENYNIK
jgi:hypothetical protein